MVTKDQKDKIHNALLVGMALADAYIYAGLTADQMQELDDDELFQMSCKQDSKETEYHLLDDMFRTAVIQNGKGVTIATQWLLEHLYSRYQAKTPDAVGNITIQMPAEIPAGVETVVK